MATTDPTIPSPPSRDQTPEQIIEAISLEIQHTNRSSEKLGREKLLSASALAVDTLIHVMLYSSDEKTRRGAANDILAYVYGTNSQRAPFADATQQAYDLVFDDITEEVSEGV